MAAALIRWAFGVLLRRIGGGTLVVLEQGRRRTYGGGAPSVTLQVRSGRMWGMLLRGSRGLASAYEACLWDSPDPAALIRLAAANAPKLDRARARIAPLFAPARLAAALAGRGATRSRRRRDVQAHYDLGDELFERMLDPTLSYSCAYFEDAGMTLEQAQLAKLERVCDKLELAPGHRVVEIGAGWGSFALHAAATRGCHVTTTTVSRAQYEHAVRRVHAEGLDDRVTVLMQDFLDLRGSYDRLVSIEMIEAIGWRRFGAFFAKCSRLLRPAGMMLLQAITIDDRAYEAQKWRKSFINTRIFPGGCLPSPEVIAHSVAQSTDMRAVGLEDITAHYVETLRRWRENFGAHAQELSRFGYDERFRRLWTLYLAYCEAGFAERRICDIQLMLAKPAWRGRKAQSHGEPTLPPARAIATG